MLLRRTALTRSTPLKSVTRLARMSAKKTAELVAAGKPAVPTQRARYTDPTRLVVGKVWMRAGGVCEFPLCGLPAVDPHHRYERGSGGTGPKSPAAPWINQTANLLAACRHHNDWCSNGSPKKAEAIGWIIKRPTVAASQVPVLTCHDPARVLLDDKGDWTRWAGTS